ncbi:MAG: hypothetical protein KA233_08320 [Novosphingobium sp.]|nr:hypothetical protein [Novosphingobium sp.]
MTATAARIGFISQPFRKAIVESATVKSQYGALARETEDPIETFFDSVADADTMAEARQALLGVHRRRFQATVKGVEEGLALDYTSGVAPVVDYTDSLRSIARTMLIGEVTFDMAKQRSTYSIWG